MHTPMKGRLSFCLKWWLHTTGPLFIADVAVKSCLLTCTNRTHAQEGGFLCVLWPISCLVKETEDTVSQVIDVCEGCTNTISLHYEQWLKAKNIGL